MTDPLDTCVCDGPVDNGCTCGWFLTREGFDAADLAFARHFGLTDIVEIRAERMRRQLTYPYRLLDDTPRRAECWKCGSCDWDGLEARTLIPGRNPRYACVDTIACDEHGRLNLLVRLVRGPTE